MSKYDALLAELSNPTPRTVTTRERAHTAATRVQTSIFSRLRKARGGVVAGQIAWMLIRCGQGDHADSAAALAALRAVSEADLRLFLIVARAARDSLGDPDAAALAAVVVGALEAEGGRRGQDMVKENTSCQAS